MSDRSSVPTVPNRAQGTLPTTVPAALKGGHGNGRSSARRSSVPFGGGTTRKVHAELCRRCGRAVLVGLDDDRCAMTARVNPWPLNALGEASALLNERATYELRRIGGEYVLDWRGAERISARPAGSDPRLEVMGAHECGPEDPANMRTMRISETQTDNATVADDDRPPF